MSKLTCARKETVRYCKNYSAWYIADCQRAENENSAGGTTYDRQVDDTNPWYEKWWYHAAENACSIQYS